MDGTLLNSIRNLRSGASLKDYVSVVMRRKWIILVAFASVVASTAYYISQIEDTYESYATLVIEEPNPALEQVPNMSVALASARPISFYEGILNSRSFLEMLLDTIGMDVFTSAIPRITHDEALAYIQSTISLRKTSYTSFYRFQVQARTRELAFLIASSGMGIFRVQCQEVSTEEARRTVVEIDKQLKLVRSKLEQAENDYRTFKEQTGDITGGITPELKTLQQVYADNLAQLGVKEADLEAEQRQLAKLEAQVTPVDQSKSPEYLKLRSRLQELEKERMRLEGLGIRLSSASTIDREIEEIEKQLMAYKQVGAPTVDTRMMRQWQELRKSVLEKDSELQLYKRRLESYKKAISDYKKGNPDLLGQSLELQRLERAKVIYENIYNFLLNKAEEERIKSASGGTGIKVVDIARMPDRPIAKNETRYYLLGIVFGLLLGVGLAFLLEYNDTTIKSNEDIERYLTLPVLGTIPHITLSRKDEIEVRRRSSRKKTKMTVSQYPRQLLSFSGDDSVISEAYRSLRTNLSFASPDKPLHTIILTSAGPGEGKSLTITNLAASHAQLGKKVLLVDTDLRRPILHHLFNMKREPGFAELFGDNPDYATSIRATERENLWICTAGHFTPNPAELIGSHRMSTHLEYFRKTYDIVFFDTPPVVAVTDACLLGTKVDGLLLVIKSHHTDREVAMRAVQNVRNVGVKIVGIVLNDIDLSHRYSSYGYYKYYYHYYKSKTD